MARFEFDPLEPEQPLPRAVGGVGEIDLRNVGVVAVAGVGDVEGGDDCVTAFDLEVGAWV